MIPAPFTEDVRIIVTSSRDWTDEEKVRFELNEIFDHLEPHQRLVVVHGKCRTGGDKHAATWAQDRAALGHDNVIEDPHPADWTRYKLAAGPRRNYEMVIKGARECLAFIRDNSEGTLDCIRAAETVGIPVRRFIDPTPSTRPRKRHTTAPRGITRVTTEHQNGTVTDEVRLT